jgi:hypothetical protein
MCDIAVDQTGACCVTGYTWSQDFLTQNAFLDEIQGHYDAFVTKLNPDGSLNFSTYLGGVEDDDYGYGIGMDAEGSCYVTGRANSNDFPLKNAYDQRSHITEAFLTKFNPNGTLNYSTYLGGRGYEYGSELFVQQSGRCYVVGKTFDYKFPTLASYDDSFNGDSQHWDGFVSIFNSDGALNFSTYLGGDRADEVEDIVVTPTGDMYLTGTTSSPNFPIYNAFNSSLSIGEIHYEYVDIFVMKMFAPYGDNDADVMVNYWEYQMGLNSTYFGDSELDFDRDTLSNLEEFLKGSNPYRKDTDYDGLKDNMDPWPDSFMMPTGVVVVLETSVLIILGVLVRLRKGNKRKQYT